MTVSKIEWTDRSDWNPIRGCTRVSEGCRNCYAEAIAARFSDPGQPFHGFAERTASGPRWTGKIELQESRLDLPMRWQKPSKIFVNSTFDLFAEDVPDEWIDRVFAVMALAPQHTFQVLTKRAERMRDYLTGLTEERNDDPRQPHQRILAAAYDPKFPRDLRLETHLLDLCEMDRSCLPLPNVWLGVSVEDQQRADERIPLLLDTPAAKRFISAEPLLGPIDIGWAVSRHRLNIVSGFLERGMFSPGMETLRPLDWVIVGGESGPGARPMELRWVHDIVSQCQAADVAVFVKQLGARPVVGGQRYTHPYAGTPIDRPSTGKGHDMGEWPHGIRVREFPL